MIREPAVKSRFTLLMVGCLALGAALIGRSALIQIVPNSRLEQMARRQFESKVLVRPRRGGILDRNGEPLAVNVEINSLAANPAKVRNKKTVAWLLSKATDIPFARLFQRLNEKREFVWIKRHLPESEMARLKRWKVIDPSGDLVDGLWLVKESQRVYPHGELAAHVLGDVNVDSEGLEGMELQMNEKLRGKVVSFSAIKDALGRPTFIDAVAAKHMQDGESVTLTIDASLQFAVEEELRNAIKKHGARGGSVIVMNAADGEILAMANYPAFNPNEKGIPLERRRNRAVTDGFEPGSTMKALLVASALSHGWKLSDVVWGERGQFKVQGKKISEAEAHEKFEWVSLKKMIQVSSNVAAAKVALKLGADHYFSTLQAFGIGTRTDLDFPGEIGGKVPPRKAWQPLTLANIGFGQGVLVTRLQMVRAYATILNGGWLVQPKLLKPMGSENNSEPPQRVLTQKVADQVIEALEAVTGEKGTGTKAVLPGYRVAGKTGTAQVVDPQTGTYSRTKYIGSFIGFAVGVEPKIAILASVDEAKGSYYASETAAPLFREILNAVANRFSLPAAPMPLAKAGEKTPQHTEDTLTVTRAKPEPASEEASRLQWHGANEEGIFSWTMPSLRGLTAREAMHVLKGHRFKVEIRGVGLVTSQLPTEGKTVTEGNTVRLILTEP